jgi:hypothetical protein
MDGQQRLNTVVDFYENGFGLKGLAAWHELNGKRYKDLPDTIQRGLDRRRLSATVLLVEGESGGTPRRNDIRKLVFQRLNTGGQHLNPQELRNSLYAGAFNDLLIRLSRKRLFARMWGIPPYEDNADGKGQVSDALASNRYYRRMIDVEIVLRFFALRRRGNIKGSVRSMLDRCMTEHAGDRAADVAPLEPIFDNRLQLAESVFGSRAFKYKGEEGRMSLSLPLFDAVMVGLDELWKHRSALVAHKAKIVNSVDKLLLDDEAYATIVGRPNTAKAITDRIDLVANAMRKAAGL